MSSADLLVVDDEPVNRLLLRRRLEADGYAVREAPDGEAALAAVAAKAPDLILLDVMMPGINGFEVCRALRAAVATRAIPIILVTALDDREHKIEGLEAGADDFLGKPFDPVELTARVRSLLRLREYQSLLHQRELLDTAIANLADGIIVTEPDWTIVTCNRRAQHLLNLASGDAAGIDLRAALSAFQTTADFAQADGVGELSFDVVRAGPPDLIVAARVDAVRDKEGRVAYRAVTLRDVTAERYADRLRLDFFALTAHKVRTPLTILRGLVELFCEGYGAEFRAALLRDIAPDLLRKMNEVTAIVSDLVTRSTLEDIARAPRDISVPLGPCLETAAAEARAHLSGKSFTMSVDGAETTLKMAESDLVLILRELIENAAKFNEARRPEISVRAAAGGEPPNAVTLWVADNGVGIPSEHRETIFKECFQIDEHGTGNVPGMGLGLTLVQRVAEAYGGCVEVVASSAAAGTTFRLRLP